MSLYGSKPACSHEGHVLIPSPTPSFQSLPLAYVIGITMALAFICRAALGGHTRQRWTYSKMFVRGDNRKRRLPTTTMRKLARHVVPFGHGSRAICSQGAGLHIYLGSIAIQTGDSRYEVPHNKRMHATRDTNLVMLRGY